MGYSSISGADIAVMGIIPVFYLYSIFQNFVNLVDARISAKGPVLSFPLFHLDAPIHYFFSLSYNFSQQDSEIHHSPFLGAGPKM